jgi:tRNA dimethylallyltransferase
MTRGIFSGPSADWTLREELLSMEEEEAGSLYIYLKEVDPRAAERITPNDTRRIIRALEVCLKGNARISEMQRKLTQPLPYEFVKIGLTRERKELYRLIERRVEKMIQEGLIEETKKIIVMLREHQTVSQGTGPENEKSRLLPLSSSRFPSTQAIGYKEIALYLQGEISLDEAISLIKRGTKRYAKRQFTWFRKEEDIDWVDITGIDDSRDAFLRVLDIPGIQLIK